MDDDETTQDLNVRLVMEHPNVKAVEDWCARIESFDLVVDSQNDRSIDAHGQRTKIEQALGVKIEIQGAEAKIVSGPLARIGPSDTPFNAYIPRKPKFFQH